MSESKLEKFTPSSSFLELAEYDTQAYAMTLTFKNGNSYKYLWVFPTVWQTFKESPNHSSYYSKMIKGKLLNVPIKRNNIEHKHSTPLHKQHKARTLDNGRSQRRASVVGNASHSSQRKRGNEGQAGRIPTSL
jgi:hypothetical protein